MATQLHTVHPTAFLAALSAFSETVRSPLYAMLSGNPDFAALCEKVSGKPTREVLLEMHAVAVEMINFAEITLETEFHECIC